MLAITFSGTGGNEIVKLEERPDPTLSDFEVLVEARYAGVNPADILQRNGSYPVPANAPADIPGLEVGGKVLACGRRVTRWHPGDRVMGLVSGGGLADRVAAHEDHLLAVPVGLDEQQVAALPEALITGYDALTQLSCQMGDTLAIRGINGGVGLATAQIAKALGARVLGIGRSAPMVERVRHLGIDACTHEEFAERARDLGGVDAIVELVGGEFVREDLAALRLLGRIVVVSVAGGIQCNVPLNVMMGKRARITGTVLRSRSDAEKSILFAHARRQLSGLLDTQRLVMPVDRVFQAARATDAFDHVAGAGKLGKVLLDFHDAN